MYPDRTPAKILDYTDVSQMFDEEFEFLLPVRESIVPRPYPVMQQ